MWRNNWQKFNLNGSNTAEKIENNPLNLKMYVVGRSIIGLFLRIIIEN